MTIAVYARCSSDTQTTQSQTTDLKRWVKAYADGDVQWFEDTATGKTMDRVGWNALYEQIQSRKIKTVVVWRIDRLGRTASGLTALFEELRKRKVNLISLKDGLDLSTPAGRLMANVLASVAAYETEVRSERQMAGIAAAHATGKRWGGSEKGRKTKLSVSNEVRTAVLNRLNVGEKITKIARDLSISRPTVYSIQAAAETDTAS